MKDGPPPGCVILLLVGLVVLVVCGLMVSFVDRLTPQVAAGPVYQYAVCGSTSRAPMTRRRLRARGAVGDVDPPLGGWTDAALPTSARLGYCRSSAAACRSATTRACSCSPGTAPGPAGGGRGTVRAAGARLTTRGYRS